MNRLAGLVLLSLVVVAGTACGGYQAPRPAATTSPAQTGRGEVTVTASYPRFEPSTISVTKGQSVQLKVNATDTNHTFTVDELGINIAAVKGQPVTRK